jgi:hypothetical protein
VLPALTKNYEQKAQRNQPEELPLAMKDLQDSNQFQYELLLERNKREPPSLLKEKAYTAKFVKQRKVSEALSNGVSMVPSMYHKRKSMQVPSLYVKPNNVLQFKQTGLQKQAMHILEGKSIIGNE